MWAEDRAAQGLGIVVEAVGPGRAVLSMTVTAAMTNGHRIGHGGFTFALADTAFAYACNAYGRRTVAQHCAIAYLAPVREGDRLTATAVELSRQGRGGLYDVRVANQTGAVVAEFRGHARTIEGTHLAEAAPEARP
jgi:acyl-CoA thioesterase